MLNGSARILYFNNIRYSLNYVEIHRLTQLKLKQTSRKGFSVRGTGSINTKGLPERSYKNKSFTELRSSTPIRFGEFETLNFSIAMIPEDIQLFHLLYRTSARGRRDLAEKLLGPNDEFKIDSSYTSRVSEIFGVILKSLGLEVKFVDEDDELKEYDDDELKEFEYEGQTFISTEFQFLLMKRKKEIEKEILHKYGIIEKDELKKLVMEELMTRQYIVGTEKEYYKDMPGIYIEDTVEE